MCKNSPTRQYLYFHTNQPSLLTGPKNTKGSSTLTFLTSWMQNKEIQIKPVTFMGNEMGSLKMKQLWIARFIGHEAKNIMWFQLKLPKQTAISSDLTIYIP